MVKINSLEEIGGIEKIPNGKKTKKEGGEEKKPRKRKKDSNLKDMPLADAPPIEIPSAAEADPVEPEKVLAEVPAEARVPANNPVGNVREGTEKGKFDLSRKGAMITLARINDYQELWAETEQKGDENFLAKTRELWKEFAVHGVLGKGKEGKSAVLNFTDLDGKSSLGLLKIAGINVDNVEYLKPGDSRGGKVNIDTGYRHGVVVEDEGKTAFMDHHADESGRDTSATKITYELLISLGLLQKSAQLDRLVDFVTKTDNRLYPNNREQFENSWRTIVGLQRFLKFEDLLEYFKAPRKPEAILNESGIKILKLSKRSEEQKKLVEESLKRLEQMEAEGLIVDSERHGKIAVDIGKEVKGGFDAAVAFGCSGYIIWTAGEGFFISVSGTLSEKFKQGRLVRGNMWIKPKDGEELKVKLTDVLEKMTDGKFIPTGKLKEYLDKERGERGEKFDAQSEKEKMKGRNWRSDEEELLDKLGVESVAPGTEPVVKIATEAEKELDPEDLEDITEDIENQWKVIAGVYQDVDDEEDRIFILRGRISDYGKKQLKILLGASEKQARKIVGEIIGKILSK